jgi:hypothetical protein
MPSLLIDFMKSTFCTLDHGQINFVSLTLQFSPMGKIFGVSAAAVLGTIAALCVLGLMAVWNTEDNREVLLARKV